MPKKKATDSSPEKKKKVEKEKSSLKRKNVSSKYYALSEPDMQELIVQAKQGSETAMLELLKIFDNFLQKYTTLLYEGKMPLVDYDIRRFCALFIKDINLRRALTRNKTSAVQRKQINEVMRGIVYMVKRYNTKEDVHQTVQMCFLSCSKLYQQRGEIPFSAFLYSYYFYKLKKEVDNLLIDQLGRKTFPLISDEDANLDEGSEERPPGFVAPPTPAAEDLIMCEEIDADWVAGDCGAPFCYLSTQERQLLKWRYVDGERSADIASRTLEHSNSLREQINRIKVRLRAYVEEDLAEV